MAIPAKVWERSAPYLESAMRRSGSDATLDDVRARLDDGSAFLWPGERFAGVVEVTRSAHFWLLGGDFGEVIERRAEVRGFAHMMNCDRVTLRGRPGWARVLAPYGFRQLTDLVKDLD